jgi:hypothetical protein
MRQFFLLISAALTAPAMAAPMPTGEYVRARVAEMIGDYAQAGTSFGVLLTRDPSNAIVAERAMRQAILAGDEKLTLRAARLLDARGTLPPDARLLLAAEAIAAQDWKGATAQVGKLETDRTFAFFVPL